MTTTGNGNFEVIVKREETSLPYIISSSDSKYTNLTVINTETNSVKNYELKKCIEENNRKSESIFLEKGKNKILLTLNSYNKDVNIPSVIPANYSLPEEVKITNIGIWKNCLKYKTENSEENIYKEKLIRYNMFVDFDVDISKSNINNIYIKFLNITGPSYEQKFYAYEKKKGSAKSVFSIDVPGVAYENSERINNSTLKNQKSGSIYYELYVNDTCVGTYNYDIIKKTNLKNTEYQGLTENGEKIYETEKNIKIEENNNDETEIEKLIAVNNLEIADKKSSATSKRSVSNFALDTPYLSALKTQTGAVKLQWLSAGNYPPCDSSGNGLKYEIWISYGGDYIKGAETIGQSYTIYYNIPKYAKIKAIYQLPYTYNVKEGPAVDLSTCPLEPQQVPITSIQIGVSNNSIACDGKESAYIYATAQDGRSINDKVTFSCVPPTQSSAYYINSGTFTATNKGTYRIVAKYNTLTSNEITINVIDSAVPTKINLSIDKTIISGDGLDKATPVAKVFDQYNNLMNVKVTYFINNLVLLSDYFYSSTVGTYTIRAEYKGVKSNEIPVTVTLATNPLTKLTSTSTAGGGDLNLEFTFLDNSKRVINYKLYNLNYVQALGRTDVKKIIIATGSGGGGDPSAQHEFYFYGKRLSFTGYSVPAAGTVLYDRPVYSMSLSAPSSEIALNGSLKLSVVIKDQKNTSPAILPAINYYANGTQIQGDTFYPPDIGTYKIVANTSIISEGISQNITSNEVTVNVKLAPPNITITGSEAKVSFLWGTVAGAEGYNVYLGSTLVQSGNNTTYQNTSVSIGQTYSYEVRAYKRGIEGIGSKVNVTVQPNIPTRIRLEDGYLKWDYSSTCFGSISGFRIMEKKGNNFLDNKIVATISDPNARSIPAQTINQYCANNSKSLFESSTYYVIAVYSPSTDLNSSFLTYVNSPPSDSTTLLYPGFAEAKCLISSNSSLSSTSVDILNYTVNSMLSQNGTYVEQELRKTIISYAIKKYLSIDTGYTSSSSLTKSILDDLTNYGFNNNEQLALIGVIVAANIDYSNTGDYNAIKRNPVAVALLATFILRYGPYLEQVNWKQIGISFMAALAYISTTEARQDTLDIIASKVLLNKAKSNIIANSSTREKERDKEKIVYRGLSEKNIITIADGEGIYGKYFTSYAPKTEWSLYNHVMFGSSAASRDCDPYISTSLLLSVAKKFNSIVVEIDLNRVNENYYSVYLDPQYYIYEWQKEIAVYKFIPLYAIVGIIE